VFGLWGYFLVSGVMLNVQQWGDDPNLFLRVAAYVILFISLKQIILYTPVIAIWYAILSIHSVTAACPPRSFLIS
jgi:hypothetical protein